MLAKPDLERLYRQSKEVRQPPVVLTHGLMDPRLKHADPGTAGCVDSRGGLVDPTSALAEGIGLVQSSQYIGGYSGHRRVRR